MSVETIGKIRRWHRVEKKSISEIARRLGASRNTIKRYLRSEVIEPHYGTRAKRNPVMDPWTEKLLAVLSADAALPPKQRRTGQRIYEQLQLEGFGGSYITVSRFVRAWKEEQGRHGDCPGPPLSCGRG